MSRAGDFINCRQTIRTKDDIMAKTRNYCAFYVDEPFNESNLGASATKDFCYYNTLKMWKGKDNNFPFYNAHETTYNVRDNSDWEKTLKPRLRERLRNSKNVIFFLSSITKNTRALKEELDYAINVLGLPVIVIYPDFKEKKDLLTLTPSGNSLKQSIKDLWNNLPVFRNNKSKIPVLHIPMSKNLIELALKDTGFMHNTKCSSGDYFYKP